MQPMDFLFLIPVVLLLIGGGVTLVLGRKGLNTFTLAGAWCVLLISPGFLYLAGRVAERERAWRDPIRKLESEITAARDGDGGKPSLDSLQDRRTELARQLGTVDTWRNRWWEKASFTPPRGDGPVIISIAAADKATVPPLNVGAEISVFDPRPIDEDGSFLGEFGVTAISLDAENKRYVIEASPLLPIGDEELRRWRRAADEVTVYEDLPTDRWAAFHPRAEETGDDAKPQPPEGATEGLTAEASLDRTEIPEAEWRKLVDEKRLIPGEYWSEVTMTAAEALPGVVGDQIVELDLQTALELAEGGKATLGKVYRRRRLIDPLTAMRGGVIRVDDKAPLSAEGIDALKRKMNDEIDAVETMTGQIAASFEATTAETKAKATEAEGLDEDRKQWVDDVEFAQSALEKLTARVDSVNREVEEVNRAIALLSGELREKVAFLATEIDRRTPR
jgi:uncharacterized protein YoxC